MYSVIKCTLVLLKFKDEFIQLFCSNAFKIVKKKKIQVSIRFLKIKFTIKNSIFSASVTDLYNFVECLYEYVSFTGHVSLKNCHAFHCQCISVEVLLYVI